MSNVEGREGGREGLEKEERCIWLAIFSSSKHGIGHFMSSSSGFEFKLNFKLLQLYFVVT